MGTDYLAAARNAVEGGPDDAQRAIAYALIDIAESLRELNGYSTTPAGGE